MKELDTIGIPGQSHAVKIDEFSTLYLKVKAPLATVVWTYLDVESEKGVGYFKYAIGGLEYVSSFQKINFKVGAVYQSKETSTRVDKIKYTLYISDSKEKIQEAVMCELIEDEKLFKITTHDNTPGKNSKASLIIPVKVTNQLILER